MSLKTIRHHCRVAARWVPGLDDPLVADIDQPILRSHRHANTVGCQERRGDAGTLFTYFEDTDIPRSRSPRWVIALRPAFALLFQGNNNGGGS